MVTIQGRVSLRLAFASCITAGVACGAIANGEAAGAAASGSPLTFAEALAAAKAHSPGLNQARLGVDAARLDATLVNRADDPKLGLSASAQDRVELESGDKMAGGRRTISGEVSYTLLDFGRQSSEEEKASLEVDLSGLSQEGVEEEIYFSVAKAYVAWVSASRLERLAVEQISITEKKLSQQRRDYRQGLRPQTDLLTAEVELGRARLGHLEAVENLRRKTLDLLRLMGREVPQDAGAKNLVPVPGALDDLTPPALLAVVRQWKDFRPTSTEKERGVTRQILEAEREGAQAAWYPSLALVVGVDRTGTAEAMDNSARGELRLTWDIPYNGTVGTRVESVAIRGRQLDLEDQLEKDRRQTSAATAHLALQGAAVQWQALRKQADLVERHRALVQQRYAAGQASALELSAADSEWLRVKQDLASLDQAAASATVTAAEARGIRDLAFLFTSEKASKKGEKSP